MRRIYRLVDLDCAHCAAKMETAIRKLDHVRFCSINFLSQKLSIEIEEDYFDVTMKLVIRCIKRVDPGCTLLF